MNAAYDSQAGGERVLPGLCDTRAEPVAAEVRRVLQAGEPADRETGLKSFLEKVEKGEVPPVTYEF